MLRVAVTEPGGRGFRRALLSDVWSLVNVEELRAASYAKFSRLACEPCQAARTRHASMPANRSSLEAASFERASARAEPRPPQCNPPVRATLLRGEVGALLGDRTAHEKDEEDEQGRDECRCPEDVEVGQ